MEKLNEQEFNKASDEAVQLYRRGFHWSIAMACGPVADDYGMDDAEYARLYAEVEFWAGKPKAK